MKLILLVVLLAVCVSFVTAQLGCTCSATECDCCATAPSPISASICYNSIWNNASQSLTGKLVVAGLNIASFEFTKENPTQCASVFGGSYCVNATGLQIEQTGACGCWDVDISMFGFKNQVQIGCFSFGYGASCPNTCTSGTSCQQCTSGINCGWCSSTQACLQGDQNGPFQPSGRCAAGWDYHVAQCS
eukprot:TRINITY_DN4436_c0_g1_i1.p1 TRINITY_DN4436_c0_g1~~TRINITY_DN4436_c0_g1_i1.p1  ORF type:complete len:189 (-),score=11.16 TRINITY_DN4436_c0_g1_i1:212-778(-)